MRILTTHTGSFPRAPVVRDMLVAQAKRQAVDPAAFEVACRQAVDEMVTKQCDAGLDIINDGEQSKTGFAQYVRGRLTGFDGEEIRRAPSLEARDYPNLPPGLAPVPSAQPCTAALAWKDFAAVEADIARLKAATRGHPDKKVFMSAVSPGTFTNMNPNRHYATQQDYIAAIVNVMRREYEAIAAAGFIVQIDSPDLAQHSYNLPDLPVAQWYKVVAENIEALNEATRNIPREQVRVHVCWGANEGPHHHDTELKNIVGMLLKLRASAISVVSANGRHEHEWQVWEGVKLPDGLSIVPGVIDSTTNIVEHPDTVAGRILRFAKVLGSERIIAGVDCGFGTVGTLPPQVAPELVWAKLRALVEGARLASRAL
jgi:5-methyltetrahydropteroyltriglutamate--homocysteine methyltransferase